MVKWICCLEILPYYSCAILALSFPVFNSSFSVRQRIAFRGIICFLFVSLLFFVVVFLLFIWNRIRSPGYEKCISNCKVFSVWEDRLECSEQRMANNELYISNCPHISIFTSILPIWYRESIFALRLCELHNSLDIRCTFRSVVSTLLKKHCLSVWPEITWKLWHVDTFRKDYRIQAEIFWASFSLTFFEKWIFDVENTEKLIFSLYMLYIGDVINLHVRNGTFFFRGFSCTLKRTPPVRSIKFRHRRWERRKEGYLKSKSKSRSHWTTMVFHKVGSVILIDDQYGLGNTKR